MFSFFAAFQLHYLLLAFAGAGLGIMWGAMPGLSTTMAMALLVGLSYKMALGPALAFILGVFTGSVFGGALSAILINIPGTPDAVPTMLAGHPLAKRGKGGLALGTAITFSMFGNWMGILCLLLIVPFMLAIVQKFGSWEIALLALWGVSISGTLATGDRPALKGWISGWLGLLISMIGREVIHGYMRFTFGVPELITGIPYLAILIGLFGITEIFMVLSKKQPYNIPAQVGRIIPRLKTFIKYWKTALRSMVIGLITGIIPGAGANVATFVSYGLGERVSGKDFSKGDLEGVVCSEVANNANLGAALLPTLTLGIPGSAPAAAFLAALNLHGVIVGPLIDVHHPGLLPFIYAVLVVANIAMLLLAFGLIKPSIKLFSLPRELLMPFITLLCVVGAYAIKLSMFDVSVMVILGFIGFLLRKSGIPMGPLVMGAILGPMVDENLRRAMIIFRNKTIIEVLSRPVGTLLLVVVIVTFIFSIKGRKWT